jgi:hypothetical protein
VDVYCIVKTDGKNPGIVTFQVFYNAREKHILD